MSLIINSGGACPDPSQEPTADSTGPTGKLHSIELALPEEGHSADPPERLLRADRVALYTEALLRDGPATKFPGIHLNLSEAEDLCRGALGENFPGVMPFDIPGTAGVWQGSLDGIPYSRIATKQLLLRLAKESDPPLNPFDPDNFGDLLPKINRNAFRYNPINDFGTTLRGMLYSGGFDGQSFKPFVLELIDNDPDFNEVKRIGVKSFDFSRVGKEVWRDSEGVITREAIELTLAYLKALGQKEDPPVDITTPEGFRDILGSLQKSFFTIPINKWGTNIDHMLQKAYRHSIADAVLDVVQNHEELAKIKAIGINRYDLHMKIWSKQELLEISDLFVSKLGDRIGVDVRTPEGFKSILSELHIGTVDSLILNFWGTTASSGVRSSDYKGSVSTAIIELVTADPKYSAIAEIGLEPSDFFKSPRRFWKDAEGAPTDAARLFACRWLIAIGAKSDGVSADTPIGEVERLANPKELMKHPLNFWGTTANGAFIQAYGRTKHRALTDLHDSSPSLKTFGELLAVASRLEEKVFPKRNKRIAADQNGKATGAEDPLSDNLWEPINKWLTGESYFLGPGFFDQFSEKVELQVGLRGRLCEFINSRALKADTEYLANNFKSVVDLLPADEREKVALMLIAHASHPYKSIGVEIAMKLGTLGQELLTGLKDIASNSPTKSASEALYAIYKGNPHEFTSFIATFQSSDEAVLRYATRLKNLLKS